MNLFESTTDQTVQQLGELLWEKWKVSGKD